MKAIVTLSAASFVAALSACAAPGYEGLDETDAGAQADSETEALEQLPLEAVQPASLTTLPSICGCLAGQPVPGNCNIFDFRGALSGVTFDAPPGVGCSIIFGSRFADVLTGSNQDDVICTGAGNDLAWGRKGNDKISGGPGEDELSGEEGWDELCGEEERDILRGGQGNDVLRGGEGPDTMFGGEDDDDLKGGPGGDVGNGQSGTDRCDVDIETRVACELF